MKRNQIISHAAISNWSS